MATYRWRELPLRLRVLHRAWRLRLRSDPAQIRFLLSHLERGGCAVDVGSHKGGFTYWMRHAVGPEGMVYAFEPQPRSAAYQRRMLRAFAWDNVRIEECALSSRRGTADFAARRGGFHAGGRLGPPVPGADEVTTRVETETLDYFFASARRPVSLIKIDAEGHEEEILRGGRDILEEDRPFLLLECERQRQADGSVWPILDSLLALGYTGYAIRDSRLEELQHFDESNDQPADSTGVINFAFQPPTEAA